MRTLWSKRQDVLRQWKANQLSMVEAARQLHQLGLSVDQAWDILSKV